MHGPISTTLAQPLQSFDFLPGIVGDRGTVLFVFEDLEVNSRTVIVVSRRTLPVEQDRLVLLPLVRRLVQPTLNRVVLVPRPPGSGRLPQPESDRFVRAPVQRRQLMSTPEERLVRAPESNRVVMVERSRLITAPARSAIVTALTEE